MTSENTVKDRPGGNPDDVRGQPKLIWRRGSPSVYYTWCQELRMTAEVGRSGSTKWYLKVWSNEPTPKDRRIRHVTGLRSMADAQAMVLGMPCFRCGRGRPLILMEPYTVRFRCTDRAACEAEHDRNTSRRLGSQDPHPRYGADQNDLDDEQENTT